MIGFTAGQLLTAAQLNLLVPITVTKAANQTVTNSVTLVNDNDLVFTFVANQVVHVAAHIIAQSTTTTAGLRLAWATSGTLAGIIRTVVGSPDSGTAPPDVMPVQMRSLGAGVNNLNQITSANTPYYVQENLTVVTGISGGTLQLQFAQFTAVAAQSTSLMAGTFAVARYIQ